MRDGGGRARPVRRAKCTGAITGAVTTAVVLCFSVLAPAEAFAGTASVCYNVPRTCEGQAILNYGEPFRFQAPAGEDPYVPESNDVTVSFDGASYMVRDATSPVGPGPGCEAIDQNTVRCAALPGGSLTDLSINLGHLDDTAVLDASLPTSAILQLGVDGGAGNDSVTGGMGSESALHSLSGGPGDDTLTGRGTANLDGGEGNDTLQGGPGDDSLMGGPGNDNASGGEGRDKLFGDGVADAGGVSGPGYGNDTLNGEGGADELLLGGPGSDDVRGGDGDDVLEDDRLDAIGTAGEGADGGGEEFGGEGGDFDGGVPPESGERAPDIGDRYTGGSGRDLIRYGLEVDDLGDRLPGIVVNLAGAPSGERGENDALAEIEDVYEPSGSGHDTIVGNGGPNRLSGGDGRDKIIGGGGNDTLLGGNDEDQLSGQAGNDTIPVNEGYLDRVACGAGKDSVKRDALDSVARDCERVVGPRPAKFAVESVKVFARRLEANVRVPGPGRVEARACSPVYDQDGEVVRRACFRRRDAAVGPVVGAKKAGVVRLRLELSSRDVDELRREGNLTITVEVRFTARGAAKPKVTSRQFPFVFQEASG